MRRQLSDGRWVDLVPVAGLEGERAHLETLACGRCGARLRLQVQYLLPRDRVDELHLACPACGLRRSVFFLLG